MKIPRTHATTPRPNISGSSSTSSRPWQWTTAKPSPSPSTRKPTITTPSQKVPETSASNKPTEVLPTTTRPTQPESGFSCTKAGFSPDFKDVKKFHNCVDMNGILKDFVFTCPGKSVFDPSQNVCGHPKRL